MNVDQVGRIGDLRLSRMRETSNSGLLVGSGDAFGMVQTGENSHRFLSDFMLVAAVNPCPCRHQLNWTQCARAGIEQPTAKLGYARNLLQANVSGIN